ncbi:stemmadenine O-acetyltransferase-like [Tripterygium wilfordii]|uniref:stemmadenine O-acetyltransferase-like n=1 Tax=Tripterygium wilfordii TaxID=458696 RepID=UPI0018F83AAB|nr:stemmadenine O-acetyltransferase-like [Tripterygium wilfordii]
MASSTMKVEIVSRETIKPSSPTPHNLNIHKLSLLDQMMFIEYIPVIYFYPSSGKTTPNIQSERLHILKESLSKTLTRYYPFAGRLRDEHSIECYDQGVEFVEARISCALSDVQQQQPDSEEFQKLLPIEVGTTSASTSFLLLIQVNFFQCGGMAIAVCLTHKIADGLSFFTFVKTWALIASKSDQPIQVPDFSVGSSLFPPTDSLSFHHIKFPLGNCVMRRLIFRPSGVAALKTKVASPSVPNPTRAEAITALLWKCAITSARSIRTIRTSIGNRAINLRNVLSPNLPVSATSNFLAYVATHINIEGELELQTLIRQLRNVLQEYRRKEGESLLGYKDVEIEGEADDMHFFSCSSLVGMPTFDADFGWGKPIGWTYVRLMFPNTAFIRDTRDGDGVEVLVWLSKEEMVVFERNEELLAFATLSPGFYGDSSGYGINPNSRL